ncbi:hypothetical protein EX895_005200 [Sporisorium graminicola]|uniref:Uncharacterized protein n=1 Tax=Sporisorium graminicola TaxID=280036 RepID=A0A4U7KMX9_9BASI|nr:hypothetical protein EX895_005200 [Sporisorium graminicola]TKY85660.1 hypothetical protein EX895_005200 [Sporisorium graminicola]
MERGYIFHPPPFPGVGFRQNHQIRALKSNSLPFHSAHRSVYASISHASPSLSLFNWRASVSFARSNVTSHRRKHLRKCWDCVHVCLQRGEFHLAARFLRVILNAHEWTSELEWRLALVLVASSGGNGARLSYLQQLDLNGSAPFKAAHTTPLLVAEYIAANRLNDAIELLEQRVNLYPYKAQPLLHTLLGMLYMFVGISTLFNARGAGEHVELRALDRTTKSKARLCFETAIQATQSWLRAETSKRQRMWGLHAKDAKLDGDRVKANRGAVWGRDVLADDEDWPTEEHDDIKRVRRHLDGHGDDTQDGNEAEESEAPTLSSASGSVWSDNDPDVSDSDSTEEQPASRRKSRTPSHLNPPAPPEDADDANEDPQPTATEATSAATKGPKAWAAAWTSVAPFDTPQPPLAFHLAKGFLELLNVPSSALGTLGAAGIAGTAGSEYSTGGAGAAGEEEGDAEDSDSEGGVDMLDGIQLTREEAELRLRRILFEGQPEERDSRGSTGKDGRKQSERSAVKVKRESRRPGRDGRDGRDERDERGKKRKRPDFSSGSRSTRRH